MSDLSKSRLRAWLSLLKVTRNAEGALRNKLRVEYNTTLPRFDVMAALHRFPDGLKMSQLSSELRVSNGNVTGIVERLVEEQLVRRDPIPNDRRAFLVRLSAKGFETFALQAEAHEEWVNEQLGGLSEDEVKTLVALLEKASMGSDTKEQKYA